MPFANNTQKTRALFENRKRYDFQVSKGTFDTFKNEKLLVGKLNLNDVPITPKIEKLSSLPNNPNQIPVYAFDFVSEAFSEAVTMYKDAITTGKIFLPPSVGDDPFEDLRPIRGSENILKSYKSYIRSFFEQHRVLFLKNESLNKSYVNFEEFTSVLSRLIEETEKYPYVFADFVVSNRNSVINSGLAVETANSSYHDDEQKFRDFIIHPSYTYYVNLANNFGFYVDKNVPFRWIADINSPQMQYYIIRKNRELSRRAKLNSEIILSYYYDRVTNSYNHFVNQVVSLYNLIVNTKPVVKIIDDSKCMIKSTLSTRRQIITNRSVLELLNTQTHVNLMKIYINSRDHYTEMNYSYDQKESIINNVERLLITRNYIDALNQIDSKFNFFNHLEGSRNFIGTKNIPSNLSLEQSQIKDNISFKFKTK